MVCLILFTASLIITSAYSDAGNTQHYNHSYTDALSVSINIVKSAQSSSNVLELCIKRGDV